MSLYALKVDLERWDREGSPVADTWETQILVRAQAPDGRWLSVDLYYLTKDSLLVWLHSRDACNPWAENTVGILLGHGHLHG